MSSIFEWLTGSLAGGSGDLATQTASMARPAATGFGTAQLRNLLTPSTPATGEGRLAAREEGRTQASIALMSAQAFEMAMPGALQRTGLDVLPGLRGIAMSSGLMQGILNAPLGALGMTEQAIYRQRRQLTRSIERVMGPGISTKATGGLTGGDVGDLAAAGMMGLRPGEAMSDRQLVRMLNPMGRIVTSLRTMVGPGSASEMMATFNQVTRGGMTNLSRAQGVNLMTQARGIQMATGLPSEAIFQQIEAGAAAATQQGLPSGFGSMMAAQGMMFAESADKAMGTSGFFGRLTTGQIIAAHTESTLQGRSSAAGIAAGGFRQAIEVAARREGVAVVDKDGKPVSTVELLKNPKLQGSELLTSIAKGLEAKGPTSENVIRQLTQGTRAVARDLKAIGAGDTAGVIDLLTKSSTVSSQHLTSGALGQSVIQKMQQGMLIARHLPDIIAEKHFGGNTAAARRTVRKLLSKDFDIKDLSDREIGAMNTLETALSTKIKTSVGGGQLANLRGMVQGGAQAAGLADRAQDAAIVEQRKQIAGMTTAGPAAKLLAEGGAQGFDRIAKVFEDLIQKLDKVAESFQTATQGGGQITGIDGALIQDTGGGNSDYSGG